jgi:prepilin-type N-terminal cleavage/methylation domain-containing protein
MGVVLSKSLRIRFCKRGRFMVPSKRLHSGSEQGFSLLEVLIAAVLLLISLLGISTIFMRALASNVEGRESSVVSNYARTWVEEIQSLDLEQPELQVLPGATSRQVSGYWNASTEKWEATPPTGGSAWARTTRVRLFSIRDLKDDSPNDLPVLDNPLDGATPVEHVNLREIQVSVAGQRDTGALGAQRGLEVTTARSF